MVLLYLFTLPTCSGYDYNPIDLTGFWDLCIRRWAAPWGTAQNQQALKGRDNLYAAIIVKNLSAHYLQYQDGIGCFMKKGTYVCLVFHIWLLYASQNGVLGYGYAREEDPLVKSFKAVIFCGRQADWSKVPAEINGIADRIEDIHKIFKIDLKPRIDHSIRSQNFQSLANQMANLVFLAICEKFYYNRREELEIFTRSTVRLRLTEEYYTLLLSGNVRDYDARHKTHLHEDIYNRFVKAREALGSAGFLGAGAIKPDLNGFNVLTKEIEILLLKVFPYFEAGTDISD